MLPITSDAGAVEAATVPAPLREPLTRPLPCSDAATVPFEQKAGQPVDNPSAGAAGEASGVPWSRRAHPEGVSIVSL